MAISIQHSDSYYDYKAYPQIGATGAIPRADVAVDDIVIVCLACDADATPTYIHFADSTLLTVESYSLTQVVSATNSGNTVSSICWAVIDALPTGSDDMTWRVTGLSDAEAKAASIYIVRGLDTSSPFDKSATATGSGTSPSSGATATLSQADELVVGAIGTEGPNNDTQGTWTTGAGNVSGNELWAGTNANGAAANQTISSAAEIVSATTAQTAAKTGITDRDWAACVATFKGAAEEPFPPVPGRVHKSMRNVLLRL